MASQGALQQQTAVLDGHLYKLRCYKDPSRIKRDVLECISRYPSLEPNSGVLASLPSPNPILYLHGTVPIFFNRQSYNIPVAIWVVESYPFAAPMVLVKPTTDMIIKPRHKHVDSQGITYLPYLSSWSPNTCNILGLVEVLAVTFSQDPPVRSTPPPAASPSRNPPSAYPNNSSGGYPNNSYPNNSSSSYPNNSYPNNANPNSYPNSYPNPSSSSYPNSNPGYPNSYPNNSNNNGYPNSYPNPNSFNSSEGASMAGSLTGSVIPGGPNNLYGSSYGNYPPNSQPPNGNYPPYGVQSSTGPNSYPNSGSNPYPNYGPNSGPYPPNNLSSSSLSSSNLNSSGGFPNPQPPAYSNGPSKPMGGVPSPFGNFNPSPQSSTSSYGGYDNSMSNGRKKELEDATMKTQGRLHEFYSQTTKEIDNLILHSSTLESGAHEQRKLRTINEMAQLDNEILGVEKQLDEVNFWLERHDTSNNRIDIDSITDPQDTLTKQLLDNVAEDSALEDVMYHLEKQLHRGTIDLETCLKSIRSLAGEQCQRRALIRKIHEVRRNSSPPPPGR